LNLKTETKYDSVCDIIDGNDLESNMKGF